MTFEDHFSRLAGEYATRRPRYPRELFEFISSLAPGHHACWDCGAGNGQASLSAVDFFERVYATDPSAEQIKRATAHPRISYSVATAENSGLADNSVDAVIVAQAAHWFDLTLFYREVRRVVHPGGVIALWCYNLTEISPEIDTVMKHYYYEVLGDYWSAKVRYVASHYTDLPFDFNEIPSPQFASLALWSVDDLLGYLNSWSAAQKYRDTHGSDPLSLVADEFRVLWGSVTAREVKIPLYLRVGRVQSE